MSSQSHHLYTHDGPECPVLHAKFQGCRPSCSGDDFKGVFSLYMGVAAIFVISPKLYE